MAELQIWTDRDGVTWACDAYDHGPFCRQCRIVEDPDDIVAQAQEDLRRMVEDEDA